MTDEKPERSEGAEMIARSVSNMDGLASQTMPKDEPQEFVTKSGKVLTDADIERLADEAERGYCVTRWGPGNSLLCGLPLPCPIHQDEGSDD